MSFDDESKYSHNFVSQEQINALLTSDNDSPPSLPDVEDPLGDIADFIDIDEIDRLLGGEDPMDAVAETMQEETLDNEKPRIETSEDEDLSMVSMEDIERLLAEELSPPEAPQPALEPESQPNIPLEEIPTEETLDLSEAFEEPENSDVISQDDIERLLKNSGVSEESGALQEPDEGFQISRDDIESILAETLEEDDVSSPEASASASFAPQAEESEEPLDAPPSKKKKWLIMAAGALLLLVVGTGTALHLFSDSAPDKYTEIRAVEPLDVSAMENPDTPVEPMVTTRLNSFLIPAPDGSEFSFVSMDIILTIRGVSKDPLLGYEEFYRKLLFEGLIKKVAETPQEKPVGGELRDVIRKVAGAVLPEGVIDTVRFENYQLR